MNTAWKWKVLAQRHQVVNVFIPKELNSSSTSHKHHHTECRGRVLYSGRRMANVFMPNRYIDTTHQKAIIPGFSGFIKHFSMIWDQIQCATREKSNFYEVWSDLAIAYAQ